MEPAVCCALMLAIAAALIVNIIYFKAGYWVISLFQKNGKAS